MPGNQKPNQIEYCELAEDTDPEALTMKIFVPKLQGLMNMTSEAQSSSVNTSVVLNDDGGGVSSSVNSQAPIIAKVVDPPQHKHPHHDCQGTPCPNASHPNTCCGDSILNPCAHYHHDHHFPHPGAKGKIPAGTKMICIMMNDNPKDIWVTRWLCEWPGRSMTWWHNGHCGC